jgi:hypothetical protein
MKRKWILPAALIACTALLALFVQGFVRSSLLVPTMYLLWIARSFLSSISELTYWNLLSAGLALAALISLAGTWGLLRRKRRQIYRQQGPIELVADNIINMKRGVYYKWLVAHQLGTLARALLVEQEGEDNVPQRKLLGRDWGPPEAVQNYLEAGLERWVVFYPQRRFFLPPPSTPLDADLDAVIEYLESRMETDRER